MAAYNKLHKDKLEQLVLLEKKLKKIRKSNQKNENK